MGGVIYALVMCLIALAVAVVAYSLDRYFWKLELHRRDEAYDKLLAEHSELQRKHEVVSRKVRDQAAKLEVCQQKLREIFRLANQSGPLEHRTATSSSTWNAATVGVPAQSSVTELK